jgi:hypothetical protein
MKCFQERSPRPWNGSKRNTNGKTEKKKEGFITGHSTLKEMMSVDDDHKLLKPIVYHVILSG